MRVTKRRTGMMLSTDQILGLGLLASAAHADIADWSKAVGSWIDELAFGDIEKADAVTLYSHIHELGRIETNLWVTCSRAEATCAALAA